MNKALQLIKDEYAKAKHLSKYPGSYYRNFDETPDIDTLIKISTENKELADGLEMILSIIEKLKDEAK